MSKHTCYDPSCPVDGIAASNASQSKHYASNERVDAGPTEIDMPMGCDIEEGDYFSCTKRLGRGVFLAVQVEKGDGIATVYYKQDGGMLNVITFNEYEALNSLTRD